jgi:hypothetical protein
MKKCYNCKDTKPLVDFGKDPSRGDGVRPLCKACVKIKNAKYRKENPEKVSEIEKSWYQRNKEYKVLYSHNWNISHRDRYRINKNISNKKRRVRVGALPIWTSDSLIRSFYEQADELTKVTGVKHSVDHIVPLNGKTVCGLHCHTNLQVLPLLDNIKKGNRSWPDMWR